MAKRKAVGGGTIHQRIAATLRRELRRCRPGERFASQNELAERFGAGHTTVREALSALVQEGLIERRDGAGAFVVDPKRHRVVGILCELDIAHPGTSYFYPTLVRHLRGIFLRRGYRVRLYAGHTAAGQPPPPRPSMPEFWHDVRRHRLLGLAIVASAWTKASWMDRLRRDGVPVVDHPEVDVRARHLEEMARLAAGYLLGLGRRRVAVLEWGAGGSPSPAARAALAALRAAGAAAGARGIVRVPATEYVAEGSAAVERLWRARPRPDALLVLDDILFYGMLPAFVRLGIRLPADLVVAVQTNSSDPRPAHFPIARIEADEAIEAHAFAHALLRRMEGGPPVPPASANPFRFVPLPGRP